MQKLFSIVLICAKQVKMNNIPVRIGFELIKFYFYFIKEKEQPFGFLELANGFLNKKAYILYHSFDFFPYPKLLCEKYMTTHDSSLLNVCMVANVPINLKDFFAVVREKKYEPNNKTLMNKQLKYMEENLETRLRLLKTQEWKDIYTKTNAYLMQNVKESFFKDIKNAEIYVEQSTPNFWKKKKKDGYRKKSNRKKSRSKKTIYHDGFTVETPVYPFNTCKVFKNI
jgi:hypothetical protein